MSKRSLDFDSFVSVLSDPTKTHEDITEYIEFASNDLSSPNQRLVSTFLPSITLGVLSYLISGLFWLVYLLDITSKLIKTTTSRKEFPPQGSSSKRETQASVWTTHARFLRFSMLFWMFNCFYLNLLAFSEFESISELSKMGSALAIKRKYFIVMKDISETEFLLHISFLLYIAHSFFSVLNSVLLLNRKLIR